MAKKKSANQLKESNREVRKQVDQDLDHQSTKSIDDPSEKLQSLKSLNSLLVKETFDRRQQVESLVSAKEALETELTRYGEEKESFKAELTKTNELIVGFELEKQVVSVYVKALMVQFGSEFSGLLEEKEDVERVKCERDVEIVFLKKEVGNLGFNLEAEREQLRRVCREREIVKSDFDVLSEEVNKLRMEVIEIEKREREVLEGVEKLKMETHRLVAENEESEKSMEAAIGEKDLVQKSTKVIQDLKIAIEGVVRERNDAEQERRGCKVKICDLEKEIGKLNEIVSSLRKDNQMMIANVFQLEKRVGEAAEKEKFTAKEINALVEDQKDNENSIRKLKEQNESLEKNMEIAYNEKEEMLQKLETIIQEKNAVEEDKVRKEDEIVEMQEELSELKNERSMLKESCTIEKEKNAELILEVSHSKKALDNIMLEKYEAQKSLRDEKRTAEDLRLFVSQMEKKMEETMTRLNQMNRAQDDLLKSKVEMERQIENLVKDKALAEMNLSEAQHGIDDLSSKVKSAFSNSDRALILLKKTAEVLGQDNDDKYCKGLDVKELNRDYESEAYVMELNAIRDAFRKKQKLVEEMKQQLELLQSKATNRKSFWAVFTTAIAILAAASAAYFAKGN